jgi:hypothetical protein
MSYEPRPGSVPDRVIAHLRTLPHGAERLSSQLAEAINAPPANVAACLEGAAAAGALFRRKKDSHVRAPIYWSLVDHTKANGNAHAPTAQPKVAKKTPPEGANRDVSAGQSHGADGSESPPGRGTDGAPALGAAPVFPMRASRAGPASDGSQKPNGAWHDSSTATARAGSDTPTAGPATRFEGRGGEQRDGVPPDATDRRPRQSLQKPEGAAAIAGGPAAAKETTQLGAGTPTAAANAAGAGDDAKPAVGAAAPNGLRIARWSDDTLEIRRADGTHACSPFCAQEFRQIVAFLDGQWLDPLREGGAAC